MILSLLILLICFMVFGVVDTLTVIIKMAIGAGVLALVALGIWAWIMVASI